MTAALAFAAGVAVAWLCYRDTRPAPPTPARARLGWLDPARFDTPPDRDWLPHPDWAPVLAAWDAEVAGLPWGLAATFAPAEVRGEIDDQGAAVWRIIPDRPSTAMEAAEDAGLAWLWSHDTPAASLIDLWSVPEVPS